MIDDIDAFFKNAIRIYDFNELENIEFTNIDELSYSSQKDKALLDKFVSKYLVDGSDIYLSKTNDYHGSSLTKHLQSKMRWKRSATIRLQREMFHCEGYYKSQDIHDIYAVQKGYCYYSGEMLRFHPKNFVVDHIIPVSQGGSFWPQNLALCKKTYNSQKKDKTKRKFMAELKRSLSIESYQRIAERQKEIERCKKVIDKRRRSELKNYLDNITLELVEKFQNNQIFIRYTEDGLKVFCKGIETSLPVGYIRKNTKDLKLAVERIVSLYLDDLFVPLEIQI